MNPVGRRAFLFGLVGFFLGTLNDGVEARGGGGRGTSGSRHSGSRSSGSNRTRSRSSLGTPRGRSSSSGIARSRSSGRSPGAHFRSHSGTSRSSGATIRASRGVAAARIRTVDGDTFRNGGERIRIRGMSTPEMSQPGAARARERLDQILHSGNVTVTPRAVDKYGRTVADVYVNGRNVADIMLAEGLAR